MSRKGENIYKRKDGRWEGRYIISRSENGKTKYGYIYAYNYNECKQKLLKAKYELNTKTEDDAQKKDTLRTIAASWINYKSSLVKPATISKYQVLLDLYIYPSLGDKEIEKLTKKEIFDFSHALLITGGIRRTGLSPKTVSDIISLLRVIIRYAGDYGYHISSDICNIQIKQEQPSLRILTKEEQQKLYKNLDLSIDLRDIGILVSLFTGIRIGELCALEWENISLNNGTIFVCRTLQRIPISALSNQKHTTEKKTEVVITTPKSACSIRTIPLPNFLLNKLRTIKHKQGYLLTSSEDTYIEPRSMQYHFKKVLKEASISELNFHVLRHTFATRCIELGFDVKTLSEILGHASVNITMNRYVHPSFDLKRASMERLSELLPVK